MQPQPRPVVCDADDSSLAGGVVPSPRYVVRLIPVALALTAWGAGASTLQPSRDTGTSQPSTGEVAVQGLSSIPVGNPATQMALTGGATWRTFAARHGRWAVIWNQA